MPRGTKGSYGNSHRGSRYERAVCKRLSLWISAGMKRDVFWRSAGSGAMATMRLKQNDRDTFEGQAGDVVAIRPEGFPLTQRFLIECKWYKNLDFMAYVFGHGSRIMPYWEKAVVDAAARRRWPMFITKQHHQTDLLGVNSEGLEFLLTGVSARYLPRVTPVMVLPRADLHFLLFKDFLAHVDWRMVLRRATRVRLRR